MPTSGERGTVLLDTSAALALVEPDHQFHAQVVAAVGQRPRGLAGHAVFETYSVLTRRPPPRRLGSQLAWQLIDANFPATHYLTVKASADLLPELSLLKISGGAVYDALVAAAAREASRALLSCDVRASTTYSRLGVTAELVTRDLP